MIRWRGDPRDFLGINGNPILQIPPLWPWLMRWRR
jgi:hypothetical protein